MLFLYCFVCFSLLHFYYKHHNCKNTINYLPLLVSTLLVEGWRSDLKSQNQSIICCIQIAFTSLHNKNTTASLICYAQNNDCLYKYHCFHRQKWIDTPIAELANESIGHSFFLSPFFSLKKSCKNKRTFHTATYQKIQTEKSVIPPTFTNFKVRCYKKALIFVNFLDSTLLDKGL